MIDDLRALLAVVETKSVTMAADRLHLTQSAVSRRLSHLEEVLGLRLFDRTTRSPAPTAMGRRIVEQAIPILRAVEDLVATTQEKSDPFGVMKLGVAQAVGELALLRTVQRLQTAFPKLDLRLRTDWSGGLIRQVEQGTLDAALVLLPASLRPPTTLSGRYLASVKTAIVRAKGAKRRKGRLRLAQLSNEAWVLNPLGCGYRAALEAAMGQHEDALRVAIDTFGVEAQLRLVAAGIGLGLVPLVALETSAVRREVVVVDVSDFSLSLDVWLVHQRDQGNMRKAFDLVAEVVSDRFAVSK
ncbi:MAG: LysR family transcriptional regulator [Hyphomicrobiaceae bacterium]